MYPSGLGGISLYFVMWGMAALVCVPLGTWLATRAGFRADRSLVSIGLSAVLILAGAKLLYLLEALLCPLDDYVPLADRGPLHGFRIPGGVLLLAGIGPVAIRLQGLPWRRFGDTAIIVVPLALVLVRLGCFLNGCCFGTVSTAPWALRFPEGSWVHWYHVVAGAIPAAAGWSLPVHPLQLYFVAAAGSIFVGLLVVRRFSSYPGQVQLFFYFAFFTTTALLEPVRENFLTLNWLLTPAASFLFGGLLLAHAVRKPKVIGPTVALARKAQGGISP